MALQEGKERHQYRMFCLEEEVALDSEVRVIDAFVDWLMTEDKRESGKHKNKGLRFRAKGKKREGRPAYSVGDMLKLYLYGYLNKTRGSRDLERLRRINMEVKWLLGGLQPKHSTMADFRSSNRRGLVKAFRKFNRFLRGEGLFHDDLVATDGSKFRGQNSKKNNYNEKRMDRHLEYMEKQTEAHLKELEENDKAEVNDYGEERRLDIAKRLDALTKRKEKYDQLKEEITEAHKEGFTQNCLLRYATTALFA